MRDDAHPAADRLGRDGDGEGNEADAAEPRHTRTPRDDVLFEALLPQVEGNPKGRVPRGLYRYVWRVSGRQQLRLCALAILVFPLSMVPLELQRRIVDDAISRADGRLLILLAALYALVLVTHAALKYLLSIYRGRVAEGVIRHLRRRILERERQGLETGGSTVSMMSAETEVLGGFIGEAVAEPVLQSGILLALIGYFFWLEPLVAAAGLAAFLPALILAPILQRKINRRAERRTRTLRTIGEELSADDADERDLDGQVERAYKLRLGIYKLKFLLKGLNNFVGHAGTLTVFAVGGWMVVQGELALGAVVAFASGFERLIDPARELLGFYRRWSQMRVQHRLIHKALEQQADGQARETH